MYFSCSVLLQCYKSYDRNGYDRYGFTVTKKIGGAVLRNTIKRRMRSIVREIISTRTSADYYYVLIARRDIRKRSFKELKKDICYCFSKVE